MYVVPPIVSPTSSTMHSMEQYSFSVGARWVYFRIDTFVPSSPTRLQSRAAHEYNIRAAHDYGYRCGCRYSYACSPGNDSLYHTAMH